MGKLDSRSKLLYLDERENIFKITFACIAPPEITGQERVNRKKVAQSSYLSVTSAERIGKSCEKN
jgi:hypothetical protein